jgi:hypothetical protein
MTDESERLVIRTRHAKEMLQLAVGVARRYPYMCYTTGVMNSPRPDGSEMHRYGAFARMPFLLLADVCLWMFEGAVNRELFVQEHEGAVAVADLYHFCTEVPALESIVLDAPKKAE